MRHFKPLFALGALFVTALVTAQLIASKLLLVTLPILGVVAMPGGTIAYAFTFLATDCINELYGEDIATTVVNVGFAMNFVMLALVLTAIHWPRAGGVPQDIFAGALSPAMNIVAGSLTAYIVSQHLDVRVFARLRDATGGQRLWVRNIGSTTLSQFVDTVVFVAVAFVIAPTIGVGKSLPLAVVTSLIVGQYVVKALIAVIDTPVVYGVVRALE